MAQENQMNKIRFTGSPYDEFTGQVFFVREENEDGILVSRNLNDNGGLFLAKPYGRGWEWVDDTGFTGRSQGLTMDRQQTLEFLVDSVTEWPLSTYKDPFGDMPALPHNWTWAPNDPSPYWIAVNKQTNEVISHTDWDSALDNQVDTYEVGGCPVAIDVPGYESLRSVLEAAYDQAARGKGKERHAQDLPFHAQRMQTISRMLQSERGMAYQVCKKVVEGLDLPTYEARRRELLGAINYIAGILIYWEVSENGERHGD